MKRAASERDDGGDGDDEAIKRYARERDGGGDDDDRSGDDDAMKRTASKRDAGGGAGGGGGGDGGGGDGGDNDDDDAAVPLLHAKSNCPSRSKMRSTSHHVTMPSLGLCVDMIARPRCRQATSSFGFHGNAVFEYATLLHFVHRYESVATIVPRGGYGDRGDRQRGCEYGIVLEWTQNTKTGTWSFRGQSHFSKEFRRCQSIEGVRFVVGVITMCSSSSAHQRRHANAFIYDKTEDAVELFEPNGGYVSKRFNTLGLRTEFASYFSTSLGVRLVYILAEIAPSARFQQREEWQTSKRSGGGGVGGSAQRRPGETHGYCGAWSMWWIELRLRNAHLRPLSRTDLLQVAHSYLTTCARRSGNEKGFLAFIRNYSYTLTEWCVCVLYVALVGNDEAYTSEFYRTLQHYNSFMIEKEEKTVTKKTTTTVNTTTTTTTTTAFISDFFFEVPLARLIVHSLRRNRRSLRLLEQSRERQKKDAHVDVRRIATVLKFKALVRVKARQALRDARLFAAAHTGDAQVAHATISIGGADPDATFLDCRTPLHYASMYGHVEVVAALLDAGANMNAATVYGRTALHYAALDARIDTVHALVHAGANVNATDRYGWTPLHAAAQNGNAHVASLLIGAGADVSIVTKTGKTPKAIAEVHGNEFPF